MVEHRLQAVSPAFLIVGAVAQRPFDPLLTALAPMLEAL
jgi:hypothetical protein